jgi:outer membrane protein OmpA-like peptidoglycan-associated protein
MKLKQLFIIGALAFGISLGGLLSGCTTQNAYTGESQLSKTAIGGTLGAGAGAIAGQLIGGNAASTLIGAGIGAAVGSVAGNIMDRQEAELRAQLVNSGVQVVRVNGDIRLIMPGDITFQNDRADIRGDFYSTLNSVAIVLNKFSKTTVRVAGYASKVGSDQHNQILSEQRARAVADYLIAQNVDQNRIMAVGFCFRYPVARNKKTAGQARNRRVEITIHPLS